VKCGKPSTYTVRGCRCDDCKAAGTNFNRSYKADNRHKVKVRNDKWRSENVEKVQANDRRSALKRRAREAAVDSVYFTSTELAQRMDYYGNRCYLQLPGICTGAFDNVEHVKPISHGGPNMLANLRPACWPCNRKKWYQWPFPTTTDK
jgi:5-methylcytosine-specific restriction endonuclease McrA